MPANKKYLTKSPWQRLAKITAGFIGGYLVTLSVSMALSFWMDHRAVLITLRAVGFMLWAALLIVAFLARNGWKVWGLYLLLTLLFTGLIYLGKIYNPIVYE